MIGNVLNQMTGNKATATVAMMSEPLTRAMVEFEINTPSRIAAFLAQLAHESGGFKYLVEIWGPTPQQQRYEPPGRLAQRLGNNRTGDGHRFRGRGFIQITGRRNYKKYGELLGLTLERDPDLAAQIPVACRIAGIYWKSNGLNEMADENTDASFESITRRINGGLNGLDDRRWYWSKAKVLLDVK